MLQFVLNTFDVLNSCPVCNFLLSLYIETSVYEEYADEITRRSLKSCCIKNSLSLPHTHTDTFNAANGSEFSIPQLILLT